MDFDVTKTISNSDDYNMFTKLYQVQLVNHTKLIQKLSLILSYACACAFRQAPHWLEHHPLKPKALESPHIPSTWQSKSRGEKIIQIWALQMTNPAKCSQPKCNSQQRQNTALEFVGFIQQKIKKTTLKRTC